MNKSESINELAAALAKAQSEMKGAVKDSNNPFFKSKYADLSSVWDACRAPLTKNGISVVQMPSAAEDVITVDTTLLHSSGQWISSSLYARPSKNDPQGIGSCITYLRRYSLSAMVGIAPEDDDGNAASGNSNGNGHHELPKKQLILPESEVHSPKTLEAKAKAADPLQNKFLGGKWKLVPCSYYKKEDPRRGKPLGELNRQDLAFLRDTYKATPWKGTIPASALDMEEALKAYAIERAAEKEREEVAQQHPEEVQEPDMANEDIPF